jgi:DNA processing protein
MKTPELINIIAFSLLNGVGPIFFKKNSSEISSKILLSKELHSISKKSDFSDFEKNQISALQIIENCEKLNIKIITIFDKDYPNSLLQIKDPPPILYLMGNHSLLNRAIAIIGTRKSTELGNKIASRVGSFFSENWSICNGLVDGIDRNSIVTKDTILPNVTGVLSGGLNYESTCQKVTRDLAQQVLENNGLLITEYEPNKKEDQFSGSKTSRIQAGLANALILIQSAKTGGSKYTLKAFSCLERPLAVVDFSNNSEFRESETFSANRLIIDKGRAGVMEICEIKKLDAILITKILRIGKSEDYKLIEEEIQASRAASNIGC